MIMAIKVITEDTRSGVKRNGWLCYTSEGKAAGFVDGDRHGRATLKAAFPGEQITELCSIPTKPEVYRTLKADTKGLRVVPKTEDVTAKA